MDEEGEQEEWHPQPTNWKAIGIIVVGILIFVVAVIAIVSLVGHVSSTPVSAGSFRIPNPCAQCH